MSGTLTLHWENVLGWFGTLGEQLGRLYWASTMNTLQGGGHLATTYFRGTPYELRLYQVQYGTHYVIALCETDSATLLCHQAWSLVDDRQPTAVPLRMFCTRCVRPHVVDGVCRPDGVMPLTWNNPAVSDGENIECVIRHITEIIKRDLGGRLTPA